MKIQINQSKCTLCEKCIDKCPMAVMKKQGSRIVVDHSRCIKCRLCILECPVDAIVLK